MLMGGTHTSHLAEGSSGRELILTVRHVRLLLVQKKSAPARSESHPPPPWPSHFTSSQSRAQPSLCRASRKWTERCPAGVLSG